MLTALFFLLSTIGFGIKATIAGFVGATVAVGAANYFERRSIAKFNREQATRQGVRQTIF